MHQVEYVNTYKRNHRHGIRLLRHSVFITSYLILSHHRKSILSLSFFVIKCRKTMTISLSFPYVTRFFTLCTHVHAHVHNATYLNTHTCKRILYFTPPTHRHKKTIYIQQTTRRTARTRFRMGLQIPLYQQPERHYERRATPPQPDRTSKVCLPSNPETKANCPFLIQAFVNTKPQCVSTYIYIR